MLSFHVIARRNSLLRTCFGDEAICFDNSNVLPVVEGQPIPSNIMVNYMTHTIGPIASWARADCFVVVPPPRNDDKEHLGSAR